VVRDSTSSAEHFNRSHDLSTRPWWPNSGAMGATGEGKGPAILTTQQRTDADCWSTLPRRPRGVSAASADARGDVPRVYFQRWLTCGTPVEKPLRNHNSVHGPRHQFPRTCSSKPRLRTPDSATSSLRHEAVEPADPAEESLAEGDHRSKSVTGRAVSDNDYWANAVSRMQNSVPTGPVATVHETVPYRAVSCRMEPYTDSRQHSSTLIETA